MNNYETAIKKLFAKSPHFLYTIAKHAFINCGVFEYNFKNYMETLPILIKKDLIATCFESFKNIRKNIDVEEIEEKEKIEHFIDLSNLTLNMFKTLLFYNNHSYCTKQNYMFFYVIWKDCCDGCGQNCNIVRNSGPCYTECRYCNLKIYHDHQYFDNEEFWEYDDRNNKLIEIILNFDNWCQNCCVKPLFYIEESNNECVMCDLKANYSDEFVEKLCNKYNMPEIYKKFGYLKTIKMIQNSILK
ncbi:oxoc49 [Oxyplax ochracea nucleopolyhedrovirus]|uniref:Oxoc49 n=1 Tax=Oxyplax ochracea nucleopolyhedrovirus TaxID=2083176 RepID=A0A2L0WU15_9ABAC|nr:oxoc49 [Oxyplax ochracea nucleopolyhedrovirus]AVA31148.1 oxoc49 [Oxyplax ochracea nucleopolyhedrovirus]